MPNYKILLILRMHPYYLSISNMEDTIILVQIAVVVAFLIWLVILSLKILRLSRLAKEFFAGKKGKDLEGVIKSHSKRIKDAETDIKDLYTLEKDLDKKSEFYIQKVGLVKYNAFPDNGGGISFSLALLNGHDDGIILTNIYNRGVSRIYAKPIRKGESSIHLADEEFEALEQARKNN